MVDLTQERDVDTLRQISLLLDRENQRLITKTLQLTAELARLRGVPDPEQLALAELRSLEQRRAEVLTPARTPSSPPPRPAQPGHGPRSQPALPTVEMRHELPPDQRACPACGGELTEMAGQTEETDRITGWSSTRRPCGISSTRWRGTSSRRTRRWATARSTRR